MQAPPLKDCNMNKLPEGRVALINSKPVSVLHGHDGEGGEDASSHRAAKRGWLNEHATLKQKVAAAERLATAPPDMRGYGSNLCAPLQRPSGSFEAL